ncbi:MAG: Transposase IS200 like protein [Firmicutes bacterium ADurb.Bin193]|nr:MAG: Transposase IS200 like protein [Firmicutes bacterium ADurb.Bin193]
MPRTARGKSSTKIYHIVLRGINRQNIFENDEDFTKLLQTLEVYKKKSGFEIYAYCLMSNHIHLLIKEGKEDLGLIFRRIGASYVYWYNWKYKRSGHLFQDRYKSEAVEDNEYFLTVLRYIHQNPVKAKIEKDIAKYKWSSYNEYIEKEKLCNTEFALGIFSGEKSIAVERYKKYMNEINEDKCMEICDGRYRLTDEEAKEIIRKVSKCTSATEFQKLDTKKRDSYLKKIKDKGISTRQLARLTGISRVIILKI